MFDDKPAAEMSTVSFRARIILYAATWAAALFAIDLRLWSLAYLFPAHFLPSFRPDSRMKSGPFRCFVSVGASTSSTPSSFSAPGVGRLSGSCMGGSCCSSSATSADVIRCFAGQDTDAKRSTTASLSCGRK
jgi:hypothetical protein